jgi:hypothetical protein
MLVCANGYKRIVSLAILAINGYHINDTQLTGEQLEQQQATNV